MSVSILNLRLQLLMLFVAVWPALSAGHGPVFALATPTNGKGLWSVDLSLMSRATPQTWGTMFRGMLSYGVTQDLQISLSAPWVLSSAPLPRARITGMMAGTSDLEGMIAWRFHHQGTGVGKRYESTFYTALVIPGLQSAVDMFHERHRTPGFYLALATGIASRSHYFWAGLGNVRHFEASGARTTGVFF